MRISVCVCLMSLLRWLYGSLIVGILYRYDMITKCFHLNEIIIINILSILLPISAVKPLPWVTFWRRFVTYTKIVFKQIFVCKFLIAHVLFIQTTKSRKLMCIFPQTQEFSLLELRYYFCWQRPTSIYVVSD